MVVNNRSISSYHLWICAEVTGKTQEICLETRRPPGIRSRHPESRITTCATLVDYTDWRLVTVSLTQPRRVTRLHCVVTHNITRHTNRSDHADYSHWPSVVRRSFHCCLLKAPHMRSTTRIECRRASRLAGSSLSLIFALRCYPLFCLSQHPLKSLLQYRQTDRQTDRGWCAARVRLC